MSTKTLYYIVGGLLLALVGLALSWYITASLAGGGIVAALVAWMKKDQKFRKEQTQIDEDTLKKQKQVDDEKTKLLENSEKKEVKDNTILDNKSDATLNDHLDQLAEDFKRNP